MCVCVHVCVYAKLKMVFLFEVPIDSKCTNNNDDEGNFPKAFGYNNFNVSQLLEWNYSKPSNIITDCNNDYNTEIIIIILICVLQLTLQS